LEDKLMRQLADTHQTLELHIAAPVGMEDRQGKFENWNA
jgi:hypothetical protein